MTCPICGEATKVVNSASDCEAVYRLRRCVECRYEFLTTEFEGDDKDTLLQIRREQKEITLNREERQIVRDAKKLKEMMHTLADLAGFELGDMIMTHKKTRKEYK